MHTQDIAGRAIQARITVTVRRPEWAGPAILHAYDWRLADWYDLPAARLQHIVYIPGAFADFAPEAPLALLAEGYARGLPLHVTAVDLPEYQASRLPAGWAGHLARSGGFLADAILLNEVLAQLAPRPYTLLGWSTGANYGTILATLAPERVAALALCMPAGFIDQQRRRMILRFILTIVPPLARAAQRRQLLGERPWEVNLAVLGELTKLPAVMAMGRLLARANAVPYAAQVRVPVMFVLGRRDLVFDRLVPLAARGALPALFPQAPSVAVHVLAEASHTGLSTHSAEIAALTLDLAAGVG